MVFFLGNSIVGEKEATTFYQLNGSMARLNPPHTAPLPPPGSVRVWLTRPRAGGTESSIDTDPNLQVKVVDAFMIIDPMDSTVDGAQYKYTIQFLNGTRIYETDWATARLGSELCAFSFMVHMH